MQGSFLNNVASVDPRLVTFDRSETLRVNLGIAEPMLRGA